MTESVAVGSAASPRLSPDGWRPSGEFEPLTFEQIIGLNTLFSISWLNRGLELSAPVARLTAPMSTATGFLIGSDLLITNNHVLPNAETAAATVMELNYQKNWAGQLEPIRRYQLDPSLFRTSKALDYTIVRVAGQAGSVVGFIDLAGRAEPAVNDFVTIIQHPEGGPKQICLTDNKVAAVFGDVLQYTTDTERGSSGSPVFNQAWELVGLHHAGGDLAGPDGQRYVTNEGIRINAIARDAAEFLGIADMLYGLCLGELRSPLAHVIEDGGTPQDQMSRAEELLSINTGFAFALDDWLRLNVRPGEGATLAAGAAGVAIGGAMIRSARTAGHESVATVAAPQPPTTEPLRQALAVLDPDGKTPSELYSTVLATLQASPNLLDDLATSVQPDKGLPTSAAAFLLGLVTGANLFGLTRNR